MKFKAILLLLAGLAFSPSCRQPRPALVPEISPPLVQEEMVAWTGNLAGNSLFPCGGEIGWVDAAGRIIALNVEKKTITEVLAVPFAVKVPPFRQEGFLLLQDQASDRLLMYDLAARAVTFEALHLGATRILGVDGDCLVYLEGESLTVNFWRRPGVVYRTPAGAAQFYNCEFTPERVLISTAERLHTFWKKSGRFEYERLPQPAVSPFHYDGEHIYYGSVEHYLVKYSTKKKRLSWKLKLGRALERRPFAFAGHIMASPADHTVLQVNANGSLLWWQALGSTMSFDLLAMNENLAAVLLNREIKFIDPRRRQVTVFQGMERPLGPPLAFRGDLYYMASAGGQAWRLLRVGKRYGIDVELEPAAVRWLGRSLRFTVQPQHLVEPRWECEILDAQGRPVFSKGMAGGEKATLVWVPLQPGKYLIRVRARAKNRDAQSEVPVQVLDPQRVVPGFYLHF
ncbi:MAG: hypothetical protein MUC72_06810 [Acidobacteria bacterium]|jgi:hypothetical protein|nr:hypothetical protein [Acidobacteriota bacterium]